MTVRTIELAGATIEIFPDAASAARAAGDVIARSIDAAVAARGRAVLGLATGKTPIAVYERLVSLHRAGELTFADVSTYNLDEYYPIRALDPRSYRSYMDRHLFAHVDIAANRAHVLDGTVPEAFAADHAAAFDRWIAAEGGLDVQLLGVGRNGHVGFNEPSSLATAEATALPTRLVDLHPTTRLDAVSDFGDASLVPLRALTLGLASILAAREIIVLAFGPAKSIPLTAALTGPITPELPASLLRTTSGRVTWIVDSAAASLLA